MRMYKMLGLAVAIAAASTFALTGCGGKEAKTLVRVSHTQIETHPRPHWFRSFQKLIKSRTS